MKLILKPVLVLCLAIVIYSCVTPKAGITDAIVDKVIIDYDYFDSLNNKSEVSCKRIRLDSTFRIYFAEGFEDSLLISNNDSFFIKDFFETNSSIGLAMGPKVQLNRSLLFKNKLVVKSLSNNRVLKCSLDFNFPYVEISMYDSLWFLRYSDYYCNLE